MPGGTGADVGLILNHGFLTPAQKRKGLETIIQLAILPRGGSYVIECSCQLYDLFEMSAANRFVFTVATAEKLQCVNISGQDVSMSSVRRSDMTRIFAVTRSRGPHWDPARSMDEQENWREHADFMNALYTGRFVVLGGPLDGTSDVLLIVRATTEEEIDSRFCEDVWSKEGILHLRTIVPWCIRLGAID